jgi:pectate lyase
MKPIFTIVVMLVSILVYGQNEIPAFPGAEGGGMYTTGGRGGIVYFVNSLEDTNTGDAATREGTLRWCLAQAGPRTIVFRVSGIIHLKSTLGISANTTVAGQTAPDDGICIADYSVKVNGNNVILRYLRFRMGDVTAQESDALWGRNLSNVIIDHCSMSWSTDECSSFYDNTNFTMQWCLLSESLRASVHDKGNHGYGGIWGGKTATFHHNLLAHHDSRNPRMCGSRYSNKPELELVDFRNNVIYNWGSNSGYAGEGGSYNFVNNYYKPGPTSSNPTRIFQPYPDDGSNNQPMNVWGKFYVDGNFVDGSPTVTADNWQGIHPSNTSKKKTELKADVEFEVPAVTTQSAELAYTIVLDNVGASFHRDSTDARIVNEVANKLAPVRASNGTTKAGLIDSQFDVGGWESYSYAEISVLADEDRDGMADEWELTIGLNPTDGSDQNMVDSTGYTLLEKYLNRLVYIPDTTDIVIPADTTEITDTTDVVDPTVIQIKGFETQLVVYPNPAVGNSRVRFNLEKGEFVKAEIISVGGQTVHIIAARRFNSGINMIDFDATVLRSGLYLCKITTGGAMQSIKFAVR